MKIWEIFRKYFWFILLISAAFVSYLIMNFPSGSYYCFKGACGYYFWGSHSHDGIWHIAIVENAFKNIPFNMPTYAGEKLMGYNYFYDIVLYLLAKIGISPIISYFKLLPIVWFFVFTYLLIVFAKKIRNDSRFVWIFLFFTYFCGSFSYYFTLVKDKTIWGSSGLLAQLFQHMALNFQFAFSLLPILYILIKMRDKKTSLSLCIIFGALIFINMGLKFYGGFITMLLVVSYFLFSYLLKDIKKMFVYLLIISLFFIASIFTFYDPLTSIKTGVIFVYSPFAFIHPITEDPSLFHMSKLTDARYALLQAKRFSIRLLVIELFNLAVFLFFYLGVRFIGLLYLPIKFAKRKIDAFDFSIITTTGISILLTTFFIQKGEWTNIVQFFYYGIFFLTIYISELSYLILKKRKKMGYALVAILMLLAIPATLDVVNLYAKYPGTTYLPKDEMTALQVLKKLPDGIVFSPLFDEGVDNKNFIKNIKRKDVPLPLFAWNDTAYVTAFSGKQSYLSDLWMERITGIDYQERLNKVLNNDCSFLKEVDYIYNNNYYQIDRKLYDCPNKLESIYGNHSASIYKVKK